MKISKSKQELARIISENGGWRELAESAAQCIGGEISFWHDTATKQRGKDWCGSYLGASDDIKFAGVKLPNWHQTILSREEYFHLYPAPDADGWIEWKGGAANPVEFGVLVDVKLANGEVLNRVSANSGAEWRHCWGDTNIIAYRLHKPEQSLGELCGEAKEENKHEHIDAKPTIEQLAADYRNAKDYAERKQQEADDAKADVGAKLKALKLAGKEHGLLVSPITAKQDPEPELVIKVQVGDEVECIKSNVTPDNFRGMVGTVLKIDCSSTPYLVDFGRYIKIWCYEVKFIRRP